MKVTVKLLNGISYECQGLNLRVMVRAKDVHCSVFDACARIDEHGVRRELPQLLSVQWPMQAVEAVLYGG